MEGVEGTFEVVGTQMGTLHMETASGTHHRDCHNFEQGMRGSWVENFVTNLTTLLLDYHHFLALHLKPNIKLKINAHF